ncbi:MAG: translocation/assembly module TamB domain-containing protein, partial [Rhodospirillaceae bacterium]
MGGHASLSGGSVDKGESRVLEGIDAAVEVRDGRLWLTRFAGRGFNGPLAGSANLPLSWAEEYLPDGWHVDGAAASPKPAAFELSAEPEVKSLGSFLGASDPGRLGGSLRLRLTGVAAAPSVAAIDARLAVEPGTATMRGVSFTLPRAAEVRIKDGRAVAEGFTLTAPGTTASLSGTVGLAGDRPIDAHLSASGALGFLSAVVPGRLAGEFATTLSATGTAADPQVSGSLSLDGASWVWQEQRLAFRDWSGEAKFAADTLTISKLEGLANGGVASVSGGIQFGRRGGAGLHLRVRDAFAEVIKGLRSQADMDLTLAATDGGALLTGTVTVTSGAYREPITAMAKLFSSPRAAAAGAAAEPSVLGAIALDVELGASTPIVIENSAGRLDMMPNIKLQGSLAEPAILGTLDMIDDGRLTLRGRSFRLTEARVAFPGVGEPTVRLLGETRVGDYAVTMRTQGPVTNLEATYTSDPPLSQRDVQSLLVTGRTSDTTSTKSGENEQFVLGAASSDLLGLAGQMVGLESVQLGRGDFELGSSDVNPAMRLTVTKGISARTRLILSQDLDNNKLTWIVAVTPKRGFEVRVSQRDNVEEVVEFRQELSFGPGVAPPSAAGSRKRAKGPRVQSLEFTGDPAYPASDLASAVTLKPRKEFDSGTWQEDRARLEEFYRVRGYATARIVPERTVVEDGSVEQVQLRYRVDPGPRTVLSVSGIDLSDGDRRDLMRVWSASVLPEFLQDDMTRYLRDLLAGRGYLRPSISVTLDTQSPGVVRADVAVDPGQATGTRRLVIEGAHAVAEPALRSALEGSPALDKSWVDPAPLVDAISELYAARGYPSARVSADPLVFDGSVAERRLHVVEGPQAIVDGITLTGASDAMAAGAKAAIALQEGQPLLPGDEAAARGRLQRFYLDRGFRSTTVRSTATPGPDGRVALAFALTEGPVSIVSAVAVKGLDATRPSVADGAITLKPGEPAGQTAISATQQRLYGLGVFRSAEISIEPAVTAPAPDAAVEPVTMTVSLEESRRYQLRYGVQLSNEYGPVFENFSSAIGVAGDIRDRNFLGRAYTLGASARYEKNLQSARGQFSLPPLVNQRLFTNFFFTARSETDTSDQSATYTDKER